MEVEVKYRDGDQIYERVFIGTKGIKEFQEIRSKHEILDYKIRQSRH